MAQSLGGEHITELAHQAAADEFDVVFIIGGDGSVNCAVEGLVNTNTALGVLPAGTANVWAQELGLNSLSWTRWMALDESARRQIQGSCQYVDVGFCNGRPFLLWAGVGLDGFIVHRLEPRSRWEKSLSIVHYSAMTLWYASQWHGLKIEIQVDGKTLEGHFVLNLISNIHLYAGGLIQLSSNNCLNDGLMDLWLLEGDDFADTIQCAWSLFNRQGEQSKKIRRIPFQSLVIKSDAQLFVQLDGEPWDGGKEVEIHVTPRAMKVLIPEQTPYPLIHKGESES